MKRIKITESQLKKIQSLDTTKKVYKITQEQFNIILNLLDKINKIVKYPKFYIDIMKLNKNKIIKLVNLRQKIKNVTNKTVYL